MGLSSYSRHCFLSRRSLIRRYLVIYSGKRERREGSEEGNFAFPFAQHSSPTSVRPWKSQQSFFMRHFHAIMPYCFPFFVAFSCFELSVGSLIHCFISDDTLTFKNLMSLCICQYSEGRSATPCTNQKKNHQFTLQENIVIITYPCILLSSFPHKGPIWVGNADLT